MGLADVVDGHKPRRVSVRLCPDADLVDRLEAVKGELEQARQASQSLSTEAVDSARQQVSELEREVADRSVEFVLQSIGRSRWTKIRDKHQPTKAQREQYRQYGQILDHNPDTFPVAAIAASLVEPVEESETETAKLVRRIWDEWNFGECERLWRACLDANMGAASVPKSWSGSVTTPDSVPRSGPPTEPDDPEASSTDGGSLAG